VEATQSRHDTPKGSPKEDGLSVVSLFSGAGGFDHGFRMAGNHLLLANEKKEAPCRTLSQHFPDGAERLDTPCTPERSDLPAIVEGDITKLDLRRLSGLQPDVLIGGPPCQSFSVMKGQKRKGIKVQGGKLYQDFVAALAVLSPKVFVFENVQGLVSANRREAYEKIKGHLSDPREFLQERGKANLAGLDSSAPGDCRYTILHSGIVHGPNFGIPQMRKRLLIIGVRDDIVDEIGPFQREMYREQVRHRLSGGGRHFQNYPLTPLEVFEGDILTNLQDRYQEVMEAYRSLPGDMPDHTPASQWVKENIEDRSLNIVEDYLRANEIGKNLFSTQSLEEAMIEHREVLDELGYLGTPVSEVETDDVSTERSQEKRSVRERMHRTPPGENYEFTRGTEWEVVGSGLSLIYRRPHPLSPAPAVVAYGGGGTYGYHYERSRSMLTNRERARLQTFRDDFSFSGTLSDVRYQIGEAVPPLMARRVAEEIRPIVEEVPDR
jgi:DNA (cytosine-5)-methyltransferase 1